MKKEKKEKVIIDVYHDESGHEFYRVYLDDGTYEMSYQYKQLPVGGIIIEF